MLDIVIFNMNMNSIIDIRNKLTMHHHALISIIGISNWNWISIRMMNINYFNMNIYIMYIYTNIYQFMKLEYQYEYTCIWLTLYTRTARCAAAVDLLKVARRALGMADGSSSSSRCVAIYMLLPVPAPPPPRRISCGLLLEEVKRREHIILIIYSILRY